MARYVPRLYIAKRSTVALLVLHWCAAAKGYVPPLYRNRYRGDRYYDACLRLQKFELVEDRRSGPKGGKRWHTTELGNVVLKVLDEHPTPLTALMLLGIPTEVIGRARYKEGIEDEIRSS